MKISVDEDGCFLLEEVFSGVGLKTRDGEYMGICMRDTGFEFNYQGTWYYAQKGVVGKRGDLSKDAPSTEGDLVACRPKDGGN